MKQLTHNQSQKGFTLVEMLLAFTLMAMLLALAYGGLRAATRQSASGQIQLEQNGHIRVTHQFIRRQINQMQPLTFNVSDDIDGERIVFQGDQDSISFVAPMPGYLGQGGPQVQTITIENSDQGRALMFNHEILQGFDPMVGMQRDPIMLMQNIEDARFEFLALDENGELAGWSSNWDNPAILPVAVRLDVVMDESQKTHWPLLTTGVRVDEMATSMTGGSTSYSDAIRSLISKPGEPR